MLILWPYETEVVKPVGVFQLFEFARVSVDLNLESDIQTSDTPLSFTVALGTVIKLRAIEVRTECRRLDEAPGSQFVFRRWLELKRRYGTTYQESYASELLKYLWHFHHLKVAFELSTWWRSRVSVHCGSLQVGAPLRRARVSEYFGELRKIADES